MQLCYWPGHLPRQGPSEDSSRNCFAQESQFNCYLIRNKIIELTIDKMNAVYESNFVAKPTSCRTTRRPSRSVTRKQALDVSAPCFHEDPGALP